MRFTRKIKEIGAVFAGLLVMNLVEADMALSDDIVDGANISNAAKSMPSKSTASKAKTKAQKMGKGNKSSTSRTAAQRTKQAGKSNSPKTLARSATKSSTHTTWERVHLTGYLRFGNGTAYATYSNDQKIRRGPALGRSLKNSGKIYRQLV